MINPIRRIKQLFLSERALRSVCSYIDVSTSVNRSIIDSGVNESVRLMAIGELKALNAIKESIEIFKV